MTQSQSQSQTDNSFSDVSGAGEIMLFGVRVKIDPMRKSVSMNNLSQYVQPANRESSNNNLDVSAAIAVAVSAEAGYATADDAVRHQSNGGRERKRGVAWTEDEHKLFLLGLQKVGKEDWRGISRNFVKTRTPTQVASHAQKYFLRQSNLNRRRRRSSLFDITTDSVSAMSTEQLNEENKGQAILEPSIPSSHQISPISAFPVQVENPVKMMTFNNSDKLNIGSTPLAVPMPVFPTSNASTRIDLNLNQKYETDSLPLSLNLSLSFDPNRSSQYQVVSGFNTGESMIRVA